MMPRRGKYYAPGTGIVKAYQPRPGYYARKYYPRKRRYVSPKSYGNFSGMGEMKFVDFVNTSDNFGTVWSSMMSGDSVSNMLQDDGENERDGRIYYIHSVHVRYVIFTDNQQGTGSPANDLRGRLVLVWDKQTNSGTIAPANVMDTSAGDQTLAFRNLLFVSRYRILMDKKWQLERDAMSEGGQDFFASGSDTSPIYSFNRRFSPPIKVVCNGTGASVANVTDNSFGIIGVTNVANGILNSNVRVRFTG